MPFLRSFISQVKREPGGIQSALNLKIKRVNSHALWHQCGQDQPTKNWLDIISFLTPSGRKNSSDWSLVQAVIWICAYWQWRPIWWDWARILVSNEVQCWYCNLMWTSAVSACTLLHQLQCGVGSMWVYPHQLPPPMPSQFRTMIVVLTIANICALLSTMMMINIVLISFSIPGEFSCFGVLYPIEKRWNYLLKTRFTKCRQILSPAGREGVWRYIRTQMTIQQFP